MQRAPIVGLTVFASGAPDVAEWQAVVWLNRYPRISVRATTAAEACAWARERATARGIVVPEPARSVNRRYT